MYEALVAQLLQVFIAQYNKNDPQASHFTQMVWKKSTHVGCAHVDCDGIFPSSFGKAHYHVCEYSPQGNVIGEFKYAYALTICMRESNVGLVLAGRTYSELAVIRCMCGVVLPPWHM
jgi:hypothetical protein